MANLSAPPATSPILGASALLDALPDATAVLDSRGVITAVNHAWRMFSLDNGGDPELTGVGVNYLQVCERAAAAGSLDGAKVYDCIREVMSGHVFERDLEYPCPSGPVNRWYVMRVTRINGPEPGVLISHVNISRRKMAEQDLERRASEDPLTGLANRSKFNQRLTASLQVRPNREPRRDVGVLYIDLDGFKPVNDTFGHNIGDELLQVIAHRIKELTRPQDTVARLGGDEFGIIAPRITDHGLATLAERVEQTVREPHTIHGTSVVVGASVGTYLATQGEDLQHCLQRADEAMYAVKRQRAGRA